MPQTVLRPQLVEILRCPESRSRLTLVDEALLARLNAAVACQSLRNVSGNVLEEPLDGALVREDAQLVYPVIEGIPHLLQDEGVLLSQLGAPR